MAKNSEPTFGQDGRGFGRYYWHIFADTASGNYLTEAIVPALTREDPRYYTLGRGGFVKRTGYALSRMLITRTDGGKGTFNVSEIVGNGAAAGIANSYYPATSNPWVKTHQRWGTQVGLDGVFNICAASEWRATYRRSAQQWIADFATGLYEFPKRVVTSGRSVGTKTRGVQVVW